MTQFPGRIVAVLVAATALGFSGPGTCSHAAEWGHLKARFAFDGTVPQREKILLNKDEEVCSKNHPLDEDLIVNPENRGIQNVVVWLELKRGESLPAIHPSYAETERAEVLLTNRHCRFEPRIALLRTTQTLVLGNEDPVAHSTVAFLTYNQPFNYGIPPAGRRGVAFNLSKVETKPAQISCPIHSWMKAFLLVQDHPYMAASDTDGRLMIHDVPAGDWTFRFWHEKAGYITSIPLDGKKAEDKKGRFTLTIRGGTDTDLGEIPLNPTVFE
ncbi:hypothetical protein GC176_11695 [bacterium]|nr:hypothetical protein [bacterium]